MLMVAPDSDGEPAENVERNVESNAREYIFGAALWPLHTCVLNSESKLVLISKRVESPLTTLLYTFCGRYRTTLGESIRERE